MPEAGPSRRGFLVGSALLLAGPLPVRARAPTAPEAIESMLGGRVGFFARNIDTGQSLSHRANERFAMCSTFKTALSAQVLDLVSDGTIASDTMLAFDRAAILPTSPVISGLTESRIDLLTACEAIVSYSDNTAANLLLELVGGPVATTAFFRMLGDDVSRLDRNEMELNSNEPGDERDTTSPAAMALVLEKLLLGSILEPRARQLLTDWMVNEHNGRDRLRAGVPSTWRVANKPGTSMNGATNDIAVVWTAQDRPIVMSAYINAPETSGSLRKQAIAQLAAHAAEVLAN